MGERRATSSVRTLDVLLEEIRGKNLREGMSTDQIDVITERLRLARLGYPENGKASVAVRAGLAAGICAAALLLTASASSESTSTVPVAPTIHMHGGAPALGF